MDLLILLKNNLITTHFPLLDLMNNFVFHTVCLAHTHYIKSNKIHVIELKCTIQPTTVNYAITVCLVHPNIHRKIPK